MASNTDYLSLFNKASDTRSRYEVSGDPRKMFPLSPYGQLYGSATLPHRIGPDGSTLYGTQGPAGTGNGTYNMLPFGNGCMASWGNNFNILGIPIAVRHGVTTNSGGNQAVTANYARVIANRIGLSTNSYTYFQNGEAVTRDTLPGTAIANGIAQGGYGAAYELFGLGGKTINAFSSGVTTLTASASVAADTLSTAYAYGAPPVPAFNNPRQGDTIRLQNDGGTLFSYHRIQNSPTATITIFPATVFATTIGRTFDILRTGFGSYSRVVQIFNSADSRWYNYYAGSTISSAEFLLPGTIQCFSRGITGGGGTNDVTTAHFMAPQTSGAAVNIKAVDVAYYKGFLLYGYGSTIGWSVAGFPTSFTTAFGGTDFPAGNISAIATNDFFTTFEYLGDQLIAIFANSIWQVQATGTVPEFAFYKLPEVCGAQTDGYFRPTCSARGAVYYVSSGRGMELAGTTAKQISDPVASHFTNLIIAGGEVSWEPLTDTVFFSPRSQLGFAYHRPTGFWTQFNLLWISPTQKAYGFGTVDTFSPSGIMQLAHYNADATSEQIQYTDNRTGGPGQVAVSPVNTPTWGWGSPVISMGDEYGSVSGIQVDVDPVGGKLVVLGGATPISATANVRQTITAIPGVGNRKLVCKKIDDPFLSLYFSGTGAAVLSGANLYLDGGGFGR